MKLNSISQGYHISVAEWRPLPFRIRVYLDAPFLDGFDNPTESIGFEIDSINEFGLFVSCGKELA